MCVPWVRAILNGFLSIFSPSVTIFKVIDFAFGHERKPGLLLPLLSKSVGLICGVDDESAVGNVLQ